VSGHHVGIDINRINRIGHGYCVVVTENIENVGGVTFGTVRHENFVGADFQSALLIFVLGDGFSQKFVALFRSVTAKRFARTEFFGRGLHRVDGGAWKWFRHVADAAANEILRGRRIGFAPRAHAARDFGEEVTSSEFEVIVVDCSHALTA
jgi:hypothetical protein